jgi:uncharacterized protein YueI
MRQGSNIDDYLKQGIYGDKEIKPEERKRFLGTLKERVVAVLAMHQVREPGTYKEIEELLKRNQEAKMYLNGNLNYSYLSDYIKLANTYKNPFTIVSNRESQSDLGLVLAYDYAIDKENIFIEKENTEQTEDENIITDFFRNLFK